ncbi:MAG: hypothetical protein E7046_09610 [Lentisphaerae bacterium]|nr:hypothetical protein [Lentisphaerota bacterium]MBR3921658.1 hypothetical protein [Kiritimatiellia bacterium]
MNIKKTLLVSVAFAMVASVSFASKSNAEVDEAAGRYKAPKSYGWTTVAVGLATPVALPWGMEKWDVFGLDLNLGYSDAMKMYGWEIALGANVARKTFAGLQTAVGFNYSNEDAYGLALSLYNMNNAEFYGLSIDAVGVSRDMYGLEANLIGSMTDRTMGGLQVSGLASAVGEDAYGVQIAGGANFARRAHGLQLALIYNQTDLLWGCQIGLVNMAFACDHGFQIGLVNVIMDNQIPFLPFVNGYF